jgi:probable rRNA maturation factor
VPAIVVRNARDAPPLDGRIVKRRAERMLTELGVEDAELSVMLTNDSGIRELNEKHREKSKATDVLSFPMDERGKGPSGATRLLGDVVISLDTAARQARQRRRELISEVTHLLAHGILHLIGYDHETDAEERRMNVAAAKLIRAARATRTSRPMLKEKMHDRVLTPRPR